MRPLPRMSGDTLRRKARLPLPQRKLCQTPHDPKK